MRHGVSWLARIETHLQLADSTLSGMQRPPHAPGPYPQAALRACPTQTNSRVLQTSVAIVCTLPVYKMSNQMCQVCSQASPRATSNFLCCICPIMLHEFLAARKGKQAYTIPVLPKPSRRHQLQKTLLPPPHSGKIHSA